MNEKQFTLKQWTEESLYFSDGEFSAHMSIGYICKKVEKKLNEQQATITELEEEKDYWKSKAMTLLMQVRRLTPRMTDKEVKEFNKELEE